MIKIFLFSTKKSECLSDQAPSDILYLKKGRGRYNKSVQGAATLQCSFIIIVDGCTLVADASKHQMVSYFFLSITLYSLRY